MKKINCCSKCVIFIVYKEEYLNKIKRISIDIENCPKWKK